MHCSRVGVVGAGTMGQGIAEMLAWQGLDVVLIERSAEKLEQAFEHIEASLDKQMEKWAITASEKKLILSRIHKETDMNRLAVCELVIESINEDLELKKQLFMQLDAICPPHVILASNTSTLSLTEIAAVTERPERVIGLHFLYPVSKIHLVEIVRGLKTSEETFAFTKRFAEDTIQKRGIQVYESPGFVTTRLICVLINEAMHTLSERVASAEDIDTAMRIGYSFHYGPLEMADRFGLDSVLAAMERMFREFGDVKYRPAVLLKQMVRAGQLGTKTGHGFFRYDRDGDRV
ncbi:3-hydroxyacyl-CoA dehydrogenase NAD-binding domain-containing protein [Paenibacillus doosanensis]|uniref:3-hydroxybutyryl-CoA dehydrogenase n=1 Tax=Paenibacillus konkukensis TaxID=2020716 RepID=A0ABY4RYR9_9BACL|nr:MULTISPECIES: 3-hydroxyacyl-CoA dehydrogenase NAD-binding domain-containing protein [Paenibacillus]MCS7459319.1 3-hydroxyacyl-CoA dehydrogenase NAD-binding domain-containing protein [Paenibacillus doosanensis]UQZ87113.1 putative 3-hydroxybutyryl-CoA dehydrogenase [Paenibacillus konkukensis]